MIVQVMVQATGGWRFRFGVTEEQARQIVDAGQDIVVPLNEPGETLTIGAGTAAHFMRIKGGATTEELLLSDVKKQLTELIRDKAWIGDGESGL